MLRKALKRSVVQGKKLVDQSPDCEIKRKRAQTEVPVLGRKKQGKKVSRDDAERVLENLVLGGDEDIIEKLQKPSLTEDVEPEELAEEEFEKKKKKAKEKKKPAWEDDDDDVESVKVTKEKRLEAVKLAGEKSIKTSTYRSRLQKQFEKVTGTPNWALPDSERKQLSEDEDSDEADLVTSTGNFITSAECLPKSILDYKLCTDANKEDQTTGKIKNVQFHPKSQVIMTAGMNQKVALYQVHGKNNPKIQSIFLENFPVHMARFTTDGNEIVMGSRHRHFFYYDMINGKIVNVPRMKGLESDNMGRFRISPDGKYFVFLGKYGHMHLISAKSKEYITTIKMNGLVGDVAFTPDGSTMYSYGDEGEVYVWEMNHFACLHRFVDEGCTGGLSLDISPNGQYIATGSKSGVVNIYEREKCLSSNAPTPTKYIMNLTTECTTVKFNPTTEILGIASSEMSNGIKMIHIPSMTVFSNFPNTKDELRVPYSLDFSLHSGYMAIGNNKGRALLYRLKHFSNY